MVGRGEGGGFRDIHVGVVELDSRGGLSVASTIVGSPSFVASQGNGRTLLRLNDGTEATQLRKSYHELEVN